MTLQSIKSLAIVGALCFLSPASGAMIEGRVNLGTNSANPIGEDFFSAASGFVQGATSHTNTVTFDDTFVEISLKITAEAFDAGGAPAGLQVNAQAAGVELGVNNDQIDAGESIKFTYDEIDFNVIGVFPPGLSFDPTNTGVELSTIRFTAFDAGVDTYTYTGVGAGGAIGDDTLTLSVTTPVEEGDMFTLTGDSGAFRVLYLSHELQYGSVPEPTSLVVAAIGMLAATRRR